MDAASEERVVETVEDLVADLTFLAEKQSLPEAEFRADRTENYAVKRALQNVVNAVIDVAEMLLMAEGGNDESVPDTNRETIERLAEETGIGEPIATELGRSAGFRNLLAHQYGGDVDDAVVYDVLQTSSGCSGSSSPSCARSSPRTDPGPHAETTGLSGIS